jgi:DNA-binding helix-hairpin-helix protein with protein kinase domain
LTGYYTGNGGTVKPDTVLGKGGEGSVFSIHNQSDFALKLYLTHLAAERHAKIANMVSAKLHASAAFVAYPIDTVFASDGRFSGFTMRIMPGRKPAHQLYSPTGRKAAFPKATYPMLVRASANIAKAVHNVHSTGCVIGDINHSGVLVSEDATVVLIDSDSFQFSFNGITYPCKVGVPEFTPPELQGKDLSKLIRSVNHDNFGLAVLLFYTLMMGRHPFAGRYLGQGDMPMDRAIAEFRFAYSSRRGAMLMEPPPNVPTLADLPLRVSDAFEGSFGPSGSTGVRPSASEWISILDAAESELIQCSSSAAHHYFRVAKVCPWCRMERGSPGFLAFVPIFPVHSRGKPLDLAQLISAVGATKDPGPAPDLATLMPPLAGHTTKTNWAVAKSKRFHRWLAGVIGVGLALFLSTAGPAGPLLALIATLASSLIALMPTSEVKEEQKKLRAAKEKWEDAKRDFEQSAGNAYFLHLRNETERLISRLQQLNSDESLRLSELVNKKRELQLRRFLEQHDIDQVKIKGIGTGRKVTLKAYGIETAADVEYHRIVAITGFGPATAKVLLDWRRKAEAKFHFNPNQSIDPTDVNSIKTEFTNKRADPEARASDALVKLQKAAANAVAAQSNPTSQASDAWVALKRAQEFEQVFRPNPQEAVQLFSVAAVCLSSFVIYSSVRYSGFSDHLQFNADNTSRAVPRPEVAPPAIGSPRGAPSSNASELGATPSVEDNPPSASWPSALARSTPAAAAGPPIGSGPGTPAASTSMPVPTLPSGAGPRALVPIVPTPDADTSPQHASGPGVTPPKVTQSGPTLDLLDHLSALRVQERLRTLGYTRDASDGSWGSRSRAALRDFRRTKGLGGDDLWDSETEEALMAGDAPRAGSRAMLGAVPAETRYSPPTGATRNPLNRLDALWIQGRLRELGFYSGNPDGIWGLNSRSALQAFKTEKGLPANSVWDAPTEAKLANPNPPLTPTSDRAGTTAPTPGSLY